MNESEAQAFIDARLLPNLDPTLTVPELDAIYSMAAAVDADAVTTYSTVGCYRAIAEGYTIKYGKAVGRFGFTTDGQQFQRNQLLDHLDHARSLWARKVQLSSSLAPKT